MAAVCIETCLKRAEELEKSSDSARLDTEVLLAHTLEKNRTYLYTWPEKTLTEKQLQCFESLMAKRKQGEPVAYILGEREFWSLPFYTHPSTLIPRPDTEVLVEYVVSKIESLVETHEQPIRILDLGTGTGAIAIAIASEFKNIHVDAVDFNEEAVQLAQKNAKRNGITNVNVFQSDWYANVNHRYDIIVSNPPYIDAEDLHLKEGDVRFEPLSALVAEDHGLADIKNIVKQGAQYLKKEGLLVVEHGWKQAQEIQAIFKTHAFQDVQTVKDYGGNDRITLGVL